MVPYDFSDGVAAIRGMAHPPGVVGSEARANKGSSGARSSMRGNPYRNWKVIVA
jgi:hypothetical protein